MHFPFFVSEAKGKHLKVFFNHTVPEMKETFRLGVTGKGGEWNLLQRWGIHLPICTKLKLQEYLGFPSKHSKLAIIISLSPDTLAYQTPHIWRNSNTSLDGPLISALSPYL